MKLAGQRHFVLSTCDTTTYHSQASDYQPELSAIGQAPILTINHASRSSIAAYTQATAPYGTYYLASTNSSCTNNQYCLTNLPWASLGNDGLISEAATMASIPGVVGYCKRDEPTASLPPKTFHQYGLIRQDDPSIVRQGEGPCPTAEQLSDMNWTAINESAQGLLHWPYSLKGLGRVTNPSAALVTSSPTAIPAHPVVCSLSILQTVKTVSVFGEGCNLPLRSKSPLRQLRPLWRPCLPNQLIELIADFPPRTSALDPQTGGPDTPSPARPPSKPPVGLRNRRQES